MLTTDYCEICGPKEEDVEYITVAGPAGPVEICTECAHLFGFIVEGEEVEDECC